MNNEELQVINSRINNINNMHLFDDALHNIKSIRDNKNGLNGEEDNFIQILDQRLYKLETIKDQLKGNAFNLQSNRNNLENDQIGKRGNSKKKTQVYGKKNKSNSVHNVVLQENNDMEREIQRKQKDELMKSIKKLGARLINLSKTPNKSPARSIIITNGPNIKVSEFELTKFGRENSDESSKTIDNINQNTESRLFMTGFDNITRNEHKGKSLKNDINIEELAFKRTNSNVMTKTFDSNSHISASSPFFKLLHPEVNKILNDKDNDAHNRRLGVNLNNAKEIEVFVNAVRTNAENRRNYRYSLIPKPKIELFIKQGSKLNKVYNKCLKEMDVAEEIDKLLGKEKHKKVSNSKRDYENRVKKLQKEQDMFIVEKGDSKGSGGDKVFIYNSQGEGKFVGQKGHQNTDVVTKISERLAYNNRNYLIQNFGQDYNKDPEFIFYEEFRDYQNHLEKMKESREFQLKKERDKHSIIENFLDKTFKLKEALINKVDNKIFKLNEKTEGMNDFEENYFIDYSVKKAPPEKKRLHKNKSMENIKSNYLPIIGQNKLN